jgi:Reverse transcriptase (RNA-dependent DNA polymerase)
MPMGSSLSPYLFNLLLRPVVRAIKEELGIRMILYVDDFLILANSKEQCEDHTRKVLELMMELGIHINIEKSVLTPSRTQEFLGFLVDTEEDPKLRVLYQKKRLIRRAIQKLLREATKGKVHIKQVAKVAAPHPFISETS